MLTRVNRKLTVGNFVRKKMSVLAEAGFVSFPVHVKSSHILSFLNSSFQVSLSLYNYSVNTVTYNFIILSDKPVYTKAKELAGKLL